MDDNIGTGKVHRIPPPGAWVTIKSISSGKRCYLQLKPEEFLTLRQTSFTKNVQLLSKSIVELLVEAENLVRISFKFGNLYSSFEPIFRVLSLGEADRARNFQRYRVGNFKIGLNGDDKAN